MNRLSVALIHHPVVDKNGELYTTAITNLDIHDIARAACTYGLDQYYLVTPIEAQRDLGKAIANFWIEGNGHRKNADRARAMELIKVVSTIDECVLSEQEIAGCEPNLISTSAKSFAHKTISYEAGKKVISENKSNILFFGTGHGLADCVLTRSNYLLEPIYGKNNYNHLSVRSAASIVLDRLCA
jgi:hypothetical protein